MLSIESVSDPAPSPATPASLYRLRLPCCPLSCRSRRRRRDEDEDDGAAEVAAAAVAAATAILEAQLGPR